MATRRTTRLDRWEPGPFTVMTLGQHCAGCQEYIAPGETAWRCPDGQVRCREHAEALKPGTETIRPGRRPGKIPGNIQRNGPRTDYPRGPGLLYLM